jgi:hypothetical protein
MYAKQLTETSWIVNSSKTGKSLGIVNLKNNNYVLLGKGNTFAKLEDIALHFGEKLEEQAELEPETTTEVNGYPCKHGIAFDIQQEEGNGISTYSNKEKGKVRYAAGYYGIKFKSGFVAAFCPKYETLQANEFIGPFKAKFDMQFEINKNNRK